MKSCIWSPSLLMKIGVVTISKTPALRVWRLKDQGVIGSIGNLRSASYKEDCDVEKDKHAYIIAQVYHYTKNIVAF